MIADRFMPSCKEVTKKLAEGELENLPWMNRLLVRIHLSLCAHCDRFSRQMELIRQALRDRWKGRPKPDALEAAKRRILARLRRS